MELIDTAVMVVLDATLAAAPLLLLNDDDDAADAAAADDDDDDDDDDAGTELGLFVFSARFRLTAAVP